MLRALDSRLAERQINPTLLYGSQQPLVDGKLFRGDTFGKYFQERTNILFSNCLSYGNDCKNKQKCVHGSLTTKS